MTASQRALARIHAVAAAAGIVPAHDYLHNWAIAQNRNSLKDMTDAELDDMANQIDADPEVMLAVFDAYAPMEWEQMDPTENAEPGDPSTLRHLFTPEQLADLNADADRNLDRLADRYRE
jgi:hypothetical protein